MLLSTSSVRALPVGLRAVLRAVLRRAARGGCRRLRGPPPVLQAVGLDAGLRDQPCLHGPALPTREPETLKP